MKILILGPVERNRPTEEILRNHGHDVSFTEYPVTLDMLKAAKVDFLVSRHYAPILKKPVTTEYAGRIINIHNTFLPYGRGIGGNFWSFLLGHPKGISIHLINDGIDTGDILYRRRVSFGPNETLRTSEAILAQALNTLLSECWADIETGQAQTSANIQSENIGSYFNRRQSEKILELLPELWDTPTRRVEELGADISLAGRFWNAIDNDIATSSQYTDNHN